MMYVEEYTVADTVAANMSRRNVQVVRKCIISRAMVVE